MIVRSVRNLVAHSGEKAYLHEIGWNKARLRHELGTRFSKFAVRLAKDFQQKAREEGGDNAHATALRYALDEPWIRSRCCGG